MSLKTGKIIKCTNCEKEVYKSGAQIKRSKELFCSKKCFDEYRLNRIEVACQNCGKKLFRVKSHIERKSKYIACGHRCLSKLWRGINHSGNFKKGNTREMCLNFKNGTQDANGYIMVLSHEHPNKTAKGYVYAHRLVMEKKLGRYLEKEEVVHHIDKNKLNNKIDNLMLFSSNTEHLAYHRNMHETLGDGMDSDKAPMYTIKEITKLI